MMWTTQFARILVFNVSRCSQAISRATETALHAADFSFWNGHCEFSNGNIKTLQAKQKVRGARAKPSNRMN
jgi:hypothetical protein